MKNIKLLQIDKYAIRDKEYFVILNDCKWIGSNWTDNGGSRSLPMNFSWKPPRYLKCRVKKF